MLRLAWRLQRRGLVGMSAVGIVFGLFQAAAYNSAAGSTPAERAAFAHQIEILGRQYTALLPIPVHVDTLSGYLQWRVYGALPMLFGFWAVMCAAGAARGDEQRGLVAEWLVAGVSTTRYVAARFSAFALTALVVVVLTSAAIDIGAGATGSWLELWPLAAVSASLLALVVCIYGIGFAAGQVPDGRNSAAGLAGAVMLVLFLLNSFSRTVEGLRPAARVVSPFFQYDLSNPLTPAGHFDVPATAGLALATVATALVAAWLMARRDLGSPLIWVPVRKHPVTDVPSRNPMLRLPVLWRLYEERRGLAAWTVGTTVLAAYFAVVTKSLIDLVKSPTGFRAYLSVVGHGKPYVAIAGFFWFGSFQLLLAVYAITQIARWSTEDGNGRLEAELSAPMARWRIVVERGAALLAATVLIVGFSAVGFYAGTILTGMRLDLGAVALASGALLPFVLSFGAAGAVLSSVVPRAAVTALAALAFSSYVLTDLGPLLKAPDWSLKLSVFSLYGRPLSDGVYWPGLWILLAVVAVGFGLSAVLMERRDVGR
jgi:ABC-2 type transport system permease protein